MRVKEKTIPKFKNEAAERKFWKKTDSADILDWKKAVRNPSFASLKPTSRLISIRLPESLLQELKRLANQKDVPYQSLMKLYLAEKVEDTVRDRRHH